MTKLIIAFLFFTFNLIGEIDSNESLSALPPISISLDAPIQIDENNSIHQRYFIEETPKRLEATLKNKQFPIEFILLVLALGVGYLAFKKLPTSRDQPPKPLLTPTERVESAWNLLSHANETLSSQEALSFFSLMDPLAKLSAEPSHYSQFSEQVKFAAYTPKKSELIDILTTFKQ